MSANCFSFWGTTKSSEAQTLYRASPLVPTGDFRPSGPLGYRLPQMKIPGDVTGHRLSIITSAK